MIKNLFLGDDYLTSQSYSNQNLYVQPPTRNPNLNSNTGFNEEKTEPSMSPNPGMLDDKSNLAPRGRLRGPLSEANLSQLDRASSIGGYGKSKRVDEPPRPPPPRAEGKILYLLICIKLDKDKVLNFLNLKMYMTYVPLIQKFI